MDCRSKILKKGSRVHFRYSRTLLPRHPWWPFSSTIHLPFCDLVQLCLITAVPFIQKTPNQSVLTDIGWWHTQLNSPFCGSILFRPPPPSPADFWVDASSSWGIGIILNFEWDAWQLRPGWDKDRRNIGWAEIVAIELGLLFAIHQGYSDTHFVVRSDNQGVIHAIQGGKSRSPEQNLVLQRITLLLSHYKLWISSLYVPSLDNLADPPSCGLPAPGRTRTSSSLSLPHMLRPFLIRSPL